MEEEEAEEEEEVVEEVLVCYQRFSARSVVISGSFVISGSPLVSYEQMTNSISTYWPKIFCLVACVVQY